MAVAAAGTVGASLNLVGSASTAVTKIVELSSQIPAVSNWWSGADPSGASGVIVTVGIGMFEGGDQDDFGGDCLKVSDFTSQGTFTGNGRFDHMEQDVAKGLSLGGANSPEAWQLTITAGGSNAVCVQYVELGWQGTLTSGFDGTWGRDCNQDCGSGAKHPLQEMWVDMEKMVAGAPVTGSNSSTQKYCNDQAMKFSSKTGDGTKNPSVPDGLTQDKQGNGPAPGIAAPGSSQPQTRGQPQHPHLPPGKRDLPNAGTPAKVDNPSPVSSISAIAKEIGSYKSSDGKSSASEQVLVISDIESHSAEDLCGSEFSRGPDFVSHYEKKFCDMKTRKTHPLCEGSVQTDCFDLDHVGKKLHKRGGEGDGTTKGYKNVDSWSANDAGSAASASAKSTPKTGQA